MPQTVDQFARSLISAGLATDDDVKMLWGAIPADQKPDDAEQFAKLLVARQTITEFQAEQLLSDSPMTLVLGDYVLLSKIGAGGMGQVFRARHRRMDREVAIKFLPEEVAKDSDAVQRFHREVKAAAKLLHPNIVTAFDAGEVRGRHYLVMEYVAGRDLAQLIASEGPLPIARTVDYLRQAARGLAYAHRHGVVHRDIKPANLLLDKEGAVKILDMGLARIDEALFATAQEELTQPGQVMGTIDYMAPEQAFNTRTADARADIYSLGCTLWRLLTGRNLFAGETVVEKLLAHQSKPPAALKAARPDAPAALQEIFERMVAKQPDDRWQSMAELEAALASLETPVESRPNLPSSESDWPPTPRFEPTPAGAPTETLVRPAPPSPHDDRRPTVSLADPQVTTDPVSEGTLHSVRAAARPPSLPRLRDKLPRPGIMGLAGVLAVCLATWMALRHEPEDDVALTKNSSTNARSGDGESHAAAAHEEQPDETAPPLAIAPFKEVDARRHQQAWANYLGQPVEKEVELPGGEKLAMILIPAGEFLRGSEDDRQFRVRLTKPFYLGKFEVTQAQWLAVTGDRPSLFNESPTHPVEQVSWIDIQPFLAKLNDGGTVGAWRFALPTEAQWEFACRAGTLTPYSFDDGDAGLSRHAWFAENSRQNTHPTGRLLPNPFGLFDMHGNVWEWCVDWHASDYYASAPLDDPPGPSPSSAKVLRGGSWDVDAAGCRTAMRLAIAPTVRGSFGGFRLALNPINPEFLVKSEPVHPESKLSNDSRPERGPERAAVRPPPAVAPFKEGEAKQHQRAWAEYAQVLVEHKNSIGMKCVLIPAGEFTMGRKPGELSRFPPNGLYREPKPTQHKVTLTRPFQMSATEVTRRQWTEVMDDVPWRGKDSGATGDDYPANFVTKSAAREFCRRLSTTEGKRYRLPTEAEWEFACRAGSDALYFFGESDLQLGRYACRGSLQPVATREPNAWGLFDMYGNVWEWVADGSTDFSADAAVDPLLSPQHDRSILRGSCFRSAIPAEFSSGARHEWPDALASDEKGFRIVCEVELAPERTPRSAEP